MSRGTPSGSFRRTAGCSGQREAFTLIELLVVIGIIGILASLLLPSLAKGKQQGYKALCLSNLRQLGISIRLYQDDNRSHFPTKWVADTDAGGRPKLKNARFALGGPDPGHSPCLDYTYFPRARVRPLYDYMRPSAVYRCPVDRGEDLEAPCGQHLLKPSDFFCLGCSYQYNAGELHYPAEGGTRQRQADAADGLSDKPESWVPEPSRYILMHEPGARPYSRCFG
jgi:prepilin-type N-terminal cleavage/methylation domain-containing protein